MTIASAFFLSIIKSEHPPDAKCTPLEKCEHPYKKMHTPLKK
jgi:hypothetical protein